MLCSTCDERPIVYKIAQQCRVCYRKDQARAAVGTTLRVSLCAGGCGKRVHNTPYLVMPGIAQGYGSNHAWCFTCYKGLPKTKRPTRPKFKDLGLCKRCERPIGTGILPKGYLRHNSHGYCKSCTSALRKGYTRANGPKGHPGETNHASVATDQMVREMRARYDNGESATVIARDYPLSRQTVYDIVKRKTWKHVN